MRRVVWALLWGLFIVAGSAPLWLSLPEPQVPAITSVAHMDVDGEAGPVSLPVAHAERGGSAHYRLHFPLARVPEQPLYLFIPLFSQRVTAEVAGHLIGDTGNRALMLGMTSGGVALLPLPPLLLAEGENVIDLHLQSVGVMRGYLSPVYIGTADELATYYHVRVFLLEYLRLMVMAGHLLIAVVVLVLWLYRPWEPLFGWLTLLLLTSIPAYAGMLGHLHPRVFDILPYAFLVLGAASAIFPVMALLIVGLPAPRWLKTVAWAVPLACMALALTGLVPVRQLALLVNMPLNIAGLLACLLIIGWGAVVKRLGEAWLLLLPLLLAAMVSGHDIAVVAGKLDGPVLLSVYYRPLILIGISMILMRRLSVSLTQLDNVNVYLTRRLAEREAELARLHEEERREAAQRVRHEERQRLTVDLHDGLSGHLASIIALAERERAGDIERSAREALDDLRVVIHSLDISDRELPVALSGFREQLERQLRRMGIVLDWSMARLPEIAGVTPTHALNVLRILQEAVTNALRHGPATRISLRGDIETGDRARIEVENDGQPFAPQGRGAGLGNMRRRALQLGGDLRIEALAAGTRLTLVLPLQLPEPSPEQPSADLT